MQAQIRYLSIITEHPDVLADFYATYLGVRELGRGPDGDISMTDGFYNLTFLKQRPGLGEPDDRLGLNHLGAALLEGLAKGVCSLLNSRRYSVS